MAKSVIAVKLTFSRTAVRLRIPSRTRGYRAQISANHSQSSCRLARAGRARAGRVANPRHDLEPGMVPERVAEGTAGERTGQAHRSGGQRHPAVEPGYHPLTG